MAKATLTLELRFTGHDDTEVTKQYRITRIDPSTIPNACYVLALDSQARCVTAFVEERSDMRVLCSGVAGGDDEDHDFARALGIAFDSALSDLAALGL